MENKSSTDVPRKKFGEIIREQTPVLVDFYTQWCGPCKIMQPRLQELKSLVGSKAHILKIDCDKNPSISQRYGITSVPTLILFKEGEQVWRQSGVVSVDTLRLLIDEHSTLNHPS